VNLPGSPGVRDRLAVLDDVLDHLLDQLAGGTTSDGDQRQDLAAADIVYCAATAAASLALRS
jgi:hypothetical protein